VRPPRAVPITVPARGRGSAPSASALSSSLSLSITVPTSREHRTAGHAASHGTGATRRRAGPPTRSTRSRRSCGAVHRAQRAEGRCRPARESVRARRVVALRSACSAPLETATSLHAAATARSFGARAGGRSTSGSEWSAAESDRQPAGEAARSFGRFTRPPPFLSQGLLVHYTEPSTPPLQMCEA
jgi:hypothetical protein